MKLLVTGGAGYIGSVVTRVLMAGGHDVTVLDDLSTGHADAVPEGVELVRSDVREAGPVLARGGYQGVLHFAAKSLVGESVSNPAKYWAANVEGSRALLDAMREHGVASLVFSSTAATYGEPATELIDEDVPPNPTNPYGASKLAVDMMISSYAAAYGLGAVSLRYFNVGGAFGGAGERHDPETHLVPNVLAAVAGDVPAIRIFGDDYPTPDGTCVRDYVHVADLADAHVLALDAARAGRHRIYNLGSGDGYSVREVVATAGEVTGRPVPTEAAPRRAGDPPRLVASSARIAAELGWAPKRGLPDILADAWAFRCRRN